MKLNFQNFIAATALIAPGARAQVSGCSEAIHSDVTNETPYPKLFNGYFWTACDPDELVHYKMSVKNGQQILIDPCIAANPLYPTAFDYVYIENFALSDCTASGAGSTLKQYKGPNNACEYVTYTSNADQDITFSMWADLQTSTGENFVFSVTCVSGCESATTTTVATTVATAPPVDSDGDGIFDANDVCPGTIIDPLYPNEVSVVCNTGINNTAVDSQGCSLADAINDKLVECRDGSSKVGEVGTCMTKYCNELIADGTITAREKEGILNCVSM